MDAKKIKEIISALNRDFVVHNVWGKLKSYDKPNSGMQQVNFMKHAVEESLERVLRKMECGASE